jgi:chaperone protein EcpD
VRTFLFRSLAFAAAALASISIPAVASVVISGTRVVYPAGDQEVTVKLSNEGKTPALVQVWADSGDADAAPSEASAPFLITPPVSRIDPEKGQTLRVAYTGEPLPQDRESVFWLNVLEIPPKPSDAQTANHLQFAFRSRIKVFFRPGQLPGQAVDAPAQAVWSLDGEAGGYVLSVHNPSAYHVTFTTIQAAAGGEKALFDDGLMVAPGETRRVPLKGRLTAPAGVQVRYEVVNDYGGLVTGEASTRPRVMH